jgi:hypothetical protein
MGEQTAAVLAATTTAKTGRAHGLHERNLGLVLCLEKKSFSRLFDK